MRVSSARLSVAWSATIAVASLASALKILGVKVTIVVVSSGANWEATWYRLKTRVDVAEDGSGVVRGKAWKRGEPEPDAWTSEVPHKKAHQSGSPGLFGFAPQEMKVYIDNVSVTQN